MRGFLRPKPQWLRWVFVVAAATVLLRAVLGSIYSQTAVMYLAVPYLMGLLLFFVWPEPGGDTKGIRAARFFRNAIILFFASSLLLLEGWLCMLFALPLYLVVVGLVFLVADAGRDSTYKTRMAALPLLIAVLSMEGAVPGVAFQRDHSVTRSAVVSASIPDIKAQLAQPFTLERERSRFLSLFPLPHRFDAGTLEEGDVHVGHFTYRRWPVGNTHNGELHVALAEVGERHLRTEIVRNDAYFAHYLTVKGTRVEMEPLPGGQTRVSLSIDYSRDLDPAWYFGPLQKRAMGESAELLLDALFVPAGTGA